MSASVSDKPIRMVIFSTPEHLPIVRAATERMCALIGFDADHVTRAVLSVDEAMTNIIRHAYAGADDQPIEVELTAVGTDPPEALRICIRDYGRTVDPDTIRSRDLADVRPGGLGVHIMNECMDSLEYRQAEGGGTMLTMIKRLPAAEGGSCG
jgi:anti-sigma regulatory factor (Ser/Thr protein kinase)